MLNLAESHVFSLKPYVPGRPIDKTKKIKTWAKLASNENCLGPSPLALKAIKEFLPQSHLYPNAQRQKVLEEICSYHKDFSLGPQQVVLGNGLSEIIVNLVRGLVGRNEAILFSWPTFVMYRMAAHCHDRKYVEVPLKNDMSYDVQAIIKKSREKGTNAVKMIFLANPNNPTGCYLNKNELHHLISGLKDEVVLVIDEAYFEYVQKDDYPNGLSLALSRPRTVVLRTFSKVFGLAGLRIGYAIGDEAIIDVLDRVRDPFNVNALAQCAAMAAMKDQEHIIKSIKHNISYMPMLKNGLEKLGFYVRDGVGNFVIAKKEKNMPNINALCEQLLSHGVIIRPLEAFGLDDWVRVTVGTQKEMMQLFSAINTVLKQSRRLFS